MKLTTIAFLVILTFQSSIFSQIGVTTVGIQLKPIIPINYFGAGPIQLTNEFATLDLSSK